MPIPTATELQEYASRRARLMQAIGAHGDTGARQRRDLIALSGPVDGINKNGQMAEALDRRNEAQVKRVAGVVGKGADAAFAENHLVVAFTHHVFSGHQEFFQGRRHAAFKEHRLARTSGALEQRKILHVACADLDYVRILFDQIE